MNLVEKIKQHWKVILICLLTMMWMSKRTTSCSRGKEIERQAKLLEGYLPQMMSAEEVYNIIASLEDKSIPSVMKHFKANYTGSCDMRDVQEVLKSL